MGLSGAGKTTLASQVQAALPNSLWLNADNLRKEYADWDFSSEGRLRQAHRMADLANTANVDYVIADFIAALPEQREIFNADLTIWLNTISSCKYEDTNQAFQPPETCDLKFDSKDDVNLELVLSLIKSY